MVVIPGSKNEVVIPVAYRYNSKAVTAEGRVITVVIPGKHGSFATPSPSVSE